MKLLHLDSSILGENSVSRAVSAAVVAQLKSAHPQLEVAYRDLVADPLPHLTLAALADHELVDQFLASDVVVIGAAMYNFSLATQLKAWIDRVSIAGKTFRYTEAGAQGLAGGKRVIVALSRGGLYGAGSPAAAMRSAMPTQAPRAAGFHTVATRRPAETSTAIPGTSSGLIRKPALALRLAMLR